MAPCFREPLIESVMTKLYFVVRLRVYSFDHEICDDFRYFLCSYKRLKEAIKQSLDLCEKCFGKLDLVSCYDDLDHVKEYIYKCGDYRIQIFCIFVHPSRVLL